LHPLGVIETSTYHYAYESRLRDGLSDPLVEIIANPKFPSVEPDIDSTRIQVLRDPRDDLSVPGAMAEEQVGRIRSQLGAPRSRCHGHTAPRSRTLRYSSGPANCQLTMRRKDARMESGNSPARRASEKRRAPRFANGAGDAGGAPVSLSRNGGL